MCNIAIPSTVSSIVLMGEDAEVFLENFYHPKGISPEIQEKLDKVKIIETDTGYIAEIEDLDLSFLQDC